MNNEIIAYIKVEIKKKNEDIDKAYQIQLQYENEGKEKLAEGQRKFIENTRVILRSLEEDLKKLQR